MPAHLGEGGGLVGRPCGIRGRSYAPASEKSRSRVWTLSIARTFFMVACGARQTLVAATRMGRDPHSRARFGGAE